MACERLNSAESWSAARTRHARWAADLVVRAERGLRGAAKPAGLRRLERHFADLRAAQAG